MNPQTNSDKFGSYYAALRYIESLDNVSGSYQKTNIKAHPHPVMFLERMQEFLDMIGNPEKDFKYIHITGTAGKGTVSAWVHSELVRAGKKAVLFTSPHVSSTIEKIKVDYELMDPLAFADIVESLKPHIDAALMSGRYGTPSYFEIMLAIALTYFRRKKCEYVVLEVGLGGRYDATNIIKDPLVTAITNIDLDHTAVLGPRLEDIAKDKAGIIKKSSEFFTTEDRPELLAIFKEACSSAGAKFNALPVNGLDYQKRNRLLVAAICQALGIIYGENELEPLPELPARFEIVEKKPLVIIDGAHNPSKMSSTISNLNKIKYNNLVAVVAIAADKDWSKMLEPLIPQVSKIYFTRFTSQIRQCVSPKDLALKAG